MNWINQSIFNKVFATIALGSIIILLASLFSYQNSRQTVNEYDYVIGQEINSERMISAMLINFKTQVQEWKNVLLRGHDTANRDKYWGRFQDREREIQEQGEVLVNTLENDDAKNLVQRFVDAHRSMGTAYRKGYDQFVSSGYDHKAGDKAVKGIDREPAKLLDQAAEKIADVASTHSMNVSNSATTTANIALAVLIIAIALFVIITMLIINTGIVVPSRKLIAHIEHISSGDLSDNIDTQRPDELGKLADASRRLQTFLRDVSSQLKETNNQLSKAANDLMQSTEGVSDRVHTAHDTTEHVASAMTEMSATSQEVASHAANAASLANEANTAAQDGASTMQMAQSSINNLAKQVEETVETVKRLAEDTNNVGTVLSVIRGIAEQTNLLALNAAIEAARAGEQGRGFAVVADEVRTLAQKTQQSTAEIEEIIVNVQNGAQNTVQVMDASFETTSESARQFNEAAEKLNIVTSSISQINDLNTQVATAAEEQTSVAEDITKTIVEMSDLVEATASSASSTRATATSLNEMAQRADTLARTFSG